MNKTCTYLTLNVADKPNKVIFPPKGYDGWMDGRTDGWTNGLLDGWTDEWMER